MAGVDKHLESLASTSQPSDFAEDYVPDFRFRSISLVDELDVNAEEAENSLVFCGVVIMENLSFILRTQIMKFHLSLLDCFWLHLVIEFHHQIETVLQG